MANVKISDLPSASTLVGTELVPVVQSAVTSQTTVADFIQATAGFTQAGTGATGRSVQNKLRDIVSVKDFGAVGDGVTNDTAAIQAAVLAGSSIYFPAGSYKVTSAITVTSANKKLFGDGIGSTTLLNYGTGNVLELKSLGGASPTVLYLYCADMTIDCRSVGTGLYMYDIADCRIERVLVKNSTGVGILAEMVVDSTIRECVAISNVSDGIRLSDGTKAGVEFNTNQVLVDACVAYSNTSAGVRVVRSLSNQIIGGEYSSNGYGIAFEGGNRNNVYGPWVENNSTRSIQITSSTSGLGASYAGDYNRILSCMITGTGTIEVASGDSNFFQANYIGHNATIGASATRTYLGQQSGLIGTITDNGSGTINLSNYTSQYYKVSGAKRLQIDIGSNVDFTSDIVSLRFAGVKGVSSTLTPANNLTGYVDITGASTSANVTFATAESDAAYGILFGVWHAAGTPASGSEAVYMTSRATSGFTINLRTAPGVGNTVRVQWMLMR